MLIIILVMWNHVFIHREAKCLYFGWYEHHSWGQRLRNKAWQSYCYQFFFNELQNFWHPHSNNLSTEKHNSPEFREALGPSSIQNIWILDIYHIITHLVQSLAPVTHQFLHHILPPIPPPRRMTHFSLIIPNTSVHLPGTFSKRLEPRSHVLTLILTTKQEGWDDSS